MGKHAQVDSVAVRWSDGFVNHDEIKASPCAVMTLDEIEKPTGSCPYLYAWDGRQFRFVTDLLGASPLGLRVTDTKFIDTDLADVAGHLRHHIHFLKRTEFGGQDQGLRKVFDLRLSDPTNAFVVDATGVGTIAVKDPALVRDVAKAHAGNIAIGIDARNGQVAVEGWAKTANVLAIDLARRFEDAGVAALIYTDIARDGTGSGLNLQETAALASAVKIPVIASGGLGSLDDLRALKALAHPNIAGAIAGRALYDGRLDPAAALSLLQGA